MSMRDFWRIVREVIEESDVVIEVLDARMPHETRNRKAERMVKMYKKPLIMVVNKRDLIGAEVANNHRKSLSKVTKCIFISTKKNRGISSLKKEILKLKDRKPHYRRIRVGIIGYPNTGKSSLINAIAGKRKARVAAKPGFTRGVQWINAGDDIRLLDTPGVIPLGETNEVRQALMGVLDSSKIRDPMMVAKRIISLFLEQNKEALEKKYGIEVGEKSFNGIVREIGEVRHMLKKGGKIDLRRVYLVIINDWQKGELLLKD
ncbi:MAG: GTPase [Candidatus Aenigmarchaeota archaeon]|nr:GTPase [Candidatus Aenigmarchaeota archaeon]